MQAQGRPTAGELLKDLSDRPRLTVYLGAVPGVGKTHRLLNEARQLQQSGVRVMLGWVETKGRRDLEELAAGIPCIPPRLVSIGSSQFADFDLRAALAVKPQVIVLDELAHSNLEGSMNAKRWQDALALRDAGISVVGAFNIQHLETAAATAESLIGFPVREIVPLSFLKAADQVIAIDVAPEQLEERLRAGNIVNSGDVARALQGPFRPQTLRMLRELMLRTVDDLTIPTLPPDRMSAALAILPDDPAAAGVFLDRAALIAGAFNLALNIAPKSGSGDEETLQRLARGYNAHVVALPHAAGEKIALKDLNAALIAVPKGVMALSLASAPTDRDIYVVGDLPLQHRADTGTFASHPYSQTVGDRMRVGYGRLAVYLGAAAGCGKTYAMLDRAHQLQAEGIDVVAAFVETHGRADTEKKLEGLETLPRLELVTEGMRYSELDLPALLQRHPGVALIDELAHTNAPGSKFRKRYEDVLSVLRAGISVITTLNVQHLEGLNDVVRRLTGVTVRETMPDGILELADDVILIDASAQTLRDRLRAGKIYPRARVEAALQSFFRTENLTALRELALRETLRTRILEKKKGTIADLMLGVASRERDTNLIQCCGRLATRLNCGFSVVHVAANQRLAGTKEVAGLAETTRALNGQWQLEINANPAAALVRAAKQRNDATIAVEGARLERRWLQPTTFGRKLLEAGAQELLLLRPLIT